MSKVAILKFNSGDFKQGFGVTLQIGEEAAPPSIEISAQLPPLANEESYTLWQAAYRRQSNGKDLQNKFSDAIAVFNEWLLAPTFLQVRETLLDNIKRKDDVRIFIQSDLPRLRFFPWNACDLFFGYEKADVAIAHESANLLKHVYRDKMRILFILENPRGIDLATERARLAEIPDALVTLLVEPTTASLKTTLTRQKWDVLFWAGQSDAATDVTSHRESLQAAIARGLKLAMFNIGEVSELARSLSDLQLPQVILPREPIGDAIALEFFKQFLHFFAGGMPFYAAMRKARVKLRDLEQSTPCVSWLPVVLQHPATPPLLWQVRSQRDASFMLGTSGQRTLAALVRTGVADIEAHLLENEDATIEAISRDLDLLARLCRREGGQVLRSLGDGVLAYFPNVPLALGFAQIVHQALFDAAEHLPPQAVLSHRIGVHLGEVSLEATTALLAQTPPGSISLSVTAYEVVQGSLPEPPQKLEPPPEPQSGEAVPSDRPAYILTPTQSIAARSSKNRTSKTKNSKPKSTRPITQLNSSKRNPAKRNTTKPTTGLTIPSSSVKTSRSVETSARSRWLLPLLGVAIAALAGVGIWAAIASRSEQPASRSDRRDLPDVPLAPLEKKGEPKSPFPRGI